VIFYNTKLKGADFRGADLLQSITQPGSYVPEGIRCALITDEGGLIDGTTKCVK